MIVLVYIESLWTLFTIAIDLVDAWVLYTYFSSLLLYFLTILLVYIEDHLEPFLFYYRQSTSVIYNTSSTAGECEHAVSTSEHPILGLPASTPSTD